jgi:hypothetical protein
MVAWTRMVWRRMGWMAWWLLWTVLLLAVFLLPAALRWVLSRPLLLWILRLLWPLRQWIWWQLRLLVVSPTGLLCSAFTAAFRAPRSVIMPPKRALNARGCANRRIHQTGSARLTKRCHPLNFRERTKSRVLYIQLPATLIRPNEKPALPSIANAV